MASTIRVLDEHTINQIAAGEVIENPSSVVKELVENSIDAQSTEIHVEIRGGGRQLIRVTDNGVGMGSDDAVLCLERHATSKIKEVDDVLSIYTMGFRGEALPSIASISRFTLLTCPSPQDDGAGTLVIVDGGKVVRCCGAARSRGTTIEVKNLFFNVPARRKFQKSPQHDANDILKVMTNLSLAHPEIRFELVHNQETLLTAPAVKEDTFIDRLGSRIEAVLGKSFIVEARSAELELEGYRLNAWFGVSTAYRSNRNGQYLFINRRAVVVPQVSFAIRDAYGHALPPGRHPCFVLHLDLPPAFIDVNVHPQKREIRIRQSERLQRVLSLAVDKALHQTRAMAVEEAAPLPWEAPPSGFTPSVERATVPSVPALALRPASTVEPVQEQASFPSPPLAPRAPTAVTTTAGYIVLDEQSCRGLGSEQGLWICDQRAAHHRILYERLVHRKDSSEVELLLVPQPLQLSPVDRSFLADFLPQLQAMGLGIEAFGPDTWVVNAIPKLFDGMDIGALIEQLIHQLREMQESRILQKETNRCLSLAASRLALYRTQRLALPEAQHLLQQLFKCENPKECPQGKPTIVCLPPSSIGKAFK